MSDEAVDPWAGLQVFKYDADRPFSAPESGFAWLGCLGLDGGNFFTQGPVLSSDTWAYFTGSFPKGHGDELVDAAPVEPPHVGPGRVRQVNAGFLADLHRDLGDRFIRLRRQYEETTETVSWMWHEINRGLLREAGALEAVASQKATKEYDPVRVGRLQQYRTYQPGQFGLDLSQLDAKLDRHFQGPKAIVETDLPLGAFAYMVALPDAAARLPEPERRRWRPVGTKIGHLQKWEGKAREVLPPPLVSLTPAQFAHLETYRKSEYDAWEADLVEGNQPRLPKDVNPWSRPIVR